YLDSTNDEVQNVERQNYQGQRDDEQNEGGQRGSIVFIPIDVKTLLKMVDFISLTGRAHSLVQKGKLSESQIASQPLDYPTAYRILNFWGIKPSTSLEFLALPNNGYINYDSYRTRSVYWNPSSQRYDDVVAGVGHWKDEHCVSGSA